MQALLSRRVAHMTDAQRRNARVQIDRVAGEVRRNLLSTRPDDLRCLAAITIESARIAARASARVGERPPLDPDAEQRALLAFEALQTRRTRQEEAARRWRRLGGVGNVVALASLAAAVVLFSIGIGVGLASAALVMACAAGAPGGTPLGAVIGGRVAGLQVRRARTRFAAALDEVGVETLGRVRALRIQHDAWERRRADAMRLAEAAAARRLDWDEVAGATVAPQQVEAVLRWIDRLHSAQLRLVASWLVATRAAVAESDDWLARAAAHRHRFNPTLPPRRPFDAHQETGEDAEDQAPGEQLLLFQAL